MGVRAFPLSDLESEDLAERFWFVDSGVQICRLLGPLAVRAALDDVLARSAGVSTSSTVFRECHIAVRNAITTVVSFIDEIDGDVVARIGEVERQVDADPSYFGLASPGGVRWACSLVREGFALDPDPEPDDVVDFLHDHLAQFVGRRFLELANAANGQIGYRDPAACPVAEQPLEPASRRSGCSSGSRQCQVRPLLVSAKRLGTRIEGGWANRRPEAVAALDEIPTDRARLWRRSSDAPGESVCWPLGDLVVATEVADSEHLLTTDSDFVEIGQVGDLNAVVLTGLPRA